MMTYSLLLICFDSSICLPVVANSIEVRGPAWDGWWETGDISEGNIMLVVGLVLVHLILGTAVLRTCW